VAKLVDGYLQEIARDMNLPLSKFIALAEAIPDFSRLDHDDLYRAIDIYLKVKLQIHSILVSKINHNSHGSSMLGHISPSC
jgi:hypothetical protein